MSSVGSLYISPAPAEGQCKRSSYPGSLDFEGPAPSTALILIKYIYVFWGPAKKSALDPAKSPSGTAFPSKSSSRYSSIHFCLLSLAFLNLGTEFDVEGIVCIKLNTHAYISGTRILYRILHFQNYSVSLMYSFFQVRHTVQISDVFAFFYTLLHFFDFISIMVFFKLLLPFPSLGGYTLGLFETLPCKLFKNYWIHVDSGFSV